MFSISIILFYSIVSIFCFPLSLRYRHRMIRGFLIVYMVVLKKLCHINYIVEGKQHISKTHGGIVLSKHQSTWETFFLPLIFHDPAMIAKRELLWIPLFGWGLAVSSPIIINRSNKASA